MYKYRYDNVVGRNTRILQLKLLLDESEYSAARESTLTAFYTPKVVIDAMYLIDRGVPEEEVRFIHEAETETKKKALFSKVREGEVRILLGSTQKMGAGTNVQKKLVALHDIDCPWRPSDIGQRERADFFGIMPYSQEFEFYK